MNSILECVTTEEEYAGLKEVLLSNYHKVMNVYEYLSSFSGAINNFSITALILRNFLTISGIFED